MKLSALCKSILIPLCLPYTLFIGCSVVGAVVGGISQPAREGKITSSLGLDSISLGTDIQLVRFDRSTLDGSYKGLEVYPGKLYARTYDTLVARSAYSGFVPKLNQKVTLRSAGRSEEGFFKGIDRGELLFQSALDADTIAVSLEDIEWIQSSDSSRLAGNTARKLVRDGSMPGRRVILLEVDRHDQTVPYESVELVIVKSRSSGVLTGFLVGAAVDVTLLIIAATAANEVDSDCHRSASGCNNNSQSCSTGHR
jgi:hypothetical protein